MRILFGCSCSKTIIANSLCILTDYPIVRRMTQKNSLGRNKIIDDEIWRTPFVCSNHSQKNTPSVCTIHVIQIFVNSILPSYKGKHKTRTQINEDWYLFYRNRHPRKNSTLSWIVYSPIQHGANMTKLSSMNEFLLSIIAQLPLFLIRYSFSSSRCFYWYVEST